MQWPEILAASFVPFSVAIPEACRVFGWQHLIFPFFAPMAGLAVAGSLRGTRMPAGWRVVLGVFVWTVTAALVTFWFAACWPAA